MLQKIRLTKSDSEKDINAVSQGITDALQDKKYVRFTGFGSFSIVTREARMGRNLQTGKLIKMPPSNKAKFKAGKELKKAVNL